MKILALVLALSLLPAARADAHRHDCGGVCFGNGAGVTHIAPRHEAGESRIAITTEDGAAVLLLTGDVMAVQLSDRTLHKVDRKLRAKEEDGEGGPIGMAIKSAVISSVRSILNHSAECPISRLRDVEYEDGRLVVTTNRGRHVFEHLDVNDHDLMSGFSERDARAFVREFRTIKAENRL